MKFGKKYLYRHGDIKEIIKFAFLPRKISSGEWVWMEKIVIRKEYFADGKNRWWKTIHIYPLNQKFQILDDL